MIYSLRKSRNYDDLRRINFKVICRLQSSSNGMFCSCRICTDKRVAQSLCNTRGSCNDLLANMFSDKIRLACRQTCFACEFLSFYIFMIYWRLILYRDLLDRFHDFLKANDRYLFVDDGSERSFRSLQGRCHGNQF